MLRSQHQMVSNSKMLSTRHKIHIKHNYLPIYVYYILNMRSWDLTSQTGEGKSPGRSYREWPCQNEQTRRQTQWTVKYTGLLPSLPLCVGWRPRRWRRVRIWRWLACVWRVKCPTSGVQCRARQRSGCRTRDTNTRPRIRQPLPVHWRCEEKELLKERGGR